MGSIANNIKKLILAKGGTPPASPVISVNLKALIELQGGHVPEGDDIAECLSCLSECSSGGGGGSVSAPLIVHSTTEDGVLGDKTTYKSITITAESVENEAFQDCSNLESVTLVGIKNMGWNVFERCVSLTSVNIGNDVTRIGEIAFGSCTSLANITIPKSVTSIGNGAFYTCTALTGINYEGTVSEWTALDTEGIIDRENVPVHCTDGDTVASYASPE